jgi:regulator of sirC expression with transglutaminase-like and TPR domain
MISLRETERAALVKLLSDEDATVLRLLKEQFIVMGPDGRVFLESVAQGDEPTARRGAKQILIEILERDGYEAFARFCASCNDLSNLETGCWLLAKTRYPELDDAPYRVRLDGMARELRERLTGREAPRATIEVCNRYLFRRLGFRGNEEDYHDPDNSYLNRVLDRRIGIPITLSALYLLMGWRLSLPLRGVNMPGQFLLKWQSATTQFFIDPFNEGQMLDMEDCKNLCGQLGYSFSPAHLAAATSRQMLLRMCRNLREIYAESDPPRAEQLGRFIALLAQA